MINLILEFNHVSYRINYHQIYRNNLLSYPKLSRFRKSKVVKWVHLDLNISISIFSMRLEMDQDLELDNLPKKCEKYTLIETLQLISRGPD